MARKDVLLPFLREKEYMDERVSSGIEAYRKGYGRLSFKDAEGKPLEGVKIRLEQKTHDFRFGANLFMLDELPTDEKNEVYKSRFAALFNLATLPFYWKDLEPEPGKPRFSKGSPRVYRRPAVDLCLEFCEANGIEPKAHCLNYAFWTPDWVPKEIKEEKRLLTKRFSELAARYSGRIPGWEVTNETLFTRPVNPPMAFYNDPDFVHWSFKEAERLFPTNDLIINDACGNIWGNTFNSTRSNYYLQIKDELARGSRIDTIGMQYHMFYRKEDELRETEQFYDPRRLYAVMDRYADFGKPLQVTELTIPAYSENEEDEELQAEIIKNIYSMWFSHPNMEAIIYWNLIDGYAAFAPQGDMTAGENYYYGGLLRYDGTPKPAYKVLSDLIKKEWHTSLALDAASEASFKGFYGDYDMTVLANGKEYSFPFHLAKDGLNDFTFTLD